MWQFNSVTTGSGIGIRRPDWKHDARASTWIECGGWYEAGSCSSRSPGADPGFWWRVCWTGCKTERQNDQMTATTSWTYGHWRGAVFQVPYFII